MNSQLAQKDKVGTMRRILKLLRNLFIMALALACTVVGTGVIYEKVSLYKDSKSFSPPGKLIKINGHNMHIFAKGTGKETVVFASGWGIPCPYAEYYTLHNEISKKTRIAVYDRPGYGWSTVSKSSENVDVLAKEIHELLEKSGEKPPYLIVGHSLASLEVLRFTQLYKSEVKGIVLLDAGNPEYYAKDSLRDAAASSLRLKTILSRTGIFRLLFKNSPGFIQAVYAPRNNFSLVPEELKELDKAMYLKNMVNKSKVKEMNNIKNNAQKVVDAGKLGDIPLRILTSESEAEDPAWRSSQEALKEWSSAGSQRIPKGTNHNMHLYIPEEINKEILDILQR
jgi:pimeloyl-ACP methyl ester carboxylesterase